MNHSPPHPIQLAYCTDSKFLEPTLVSLYSLLKNTSAPVLAHIIGYQLTQEDRQTTRRLAALFPHAEIKTHDFDASLIEGIGTKITRIHPITFARLFLHRYLSGRVLYVDGDTCVRGDIAPLFSVDMEGKMIAGVRASHIEKLLISKKARSIFATRRRTRIRERVAKNILTQTGLQSIEHYINGGVLLFELDAIKGHPGLTARLEDVAGASQMRMMDQDWLNIVFENKIKLLDWRWNLNWKWRPRALHKSSRLPQASGASPQIKGGPVIIHYHGTRKPWHPFWGHLLRSGFHWYLHYRFTSRAFRHAMAAAEQETSADQPHKKALKTR